MPDPLAHLDAFQHALAKEPISIRDRANLNHLINRLRDEATAVMVKAYRLILTVHSNLASSVLEYTTAEQRKVDVHEVLLGLKWE